MAEYIFKSGGLSKILKNAETLKPGLLIFVVSYYNDLARISRSYLAEEPDNPWI
jgi:hypothetical protein